VVELVETRCPGGRAVETKTPVVEPATRWSSLLPGGRACRDL